MCTITGEAEVKHVLVTIAATKTLPVHNHNKSAAVP
jgi:hypothetical protein